MRRDKRARGLRRRRLPRRAAEWRGEAARGVVRRRTMTATVTCWPEDRDRARDRPIRRATTNKYAKTYTSRRESVRSNCDGCALCIPLCVLRRLNHRVARAYSRDKSTCSNDVFFDYRAWPNIGYRFLKIPFRHQESLFKLRWNHNYFRIPVVFSDFRL